MLFYDIIIKINEQFFAERRTLMKITKIKISDEKFFVQYFNCYPKRSSNLVFVDPYNFCTVKISVLEKFLSKAY